MADENYLLLLLQIVCLLMFSCGVVVLTQHPSGLAPNTKANVAIWEPHVVALVRHDDAFAAPPAGLVYFFDPGTCRLPFVKLHASRTAHRYHLIEK
jgi:hypothetical protein